LYALFTEVSTLGREPFFNTLLQLIITGGSPPYSPGLVPSIFHLFLHLKKFLASKKFESNSELKENVEKWLTFQAANFNEQGIQNLVPCYDKCLNVGGNYVEK
jgi:hypothetical protein